MERRTLWTATVFTLCAVTAGCGDTDVMDRGGEVPPGQEIEDAGVEREVEPVDLQAQPWVREGGTVEFNGRSWMLAGEPVFDPAVERVGEYRGTPLYADVNVVPPYDELYIPLENDYWQLLEPVEGADEAETPGVMEGIEIDTAQ